MSEMTDALREFGERLAKDGYPPATIERAASRMEAMEAEIARLHQAWRPRSLALALRDADVHDELDLVFGGDGDNGEVLVDLLEKVLPLRVASDGRYPR